MRRGSGAIAARAILDAVCRGTVRQRVLVEGGPRLLGDFYAERLVDEQFLTLAPQIVGRARDDRRFSLVMGQLFAPGDGRWATLHDVRRGGDLLFLRYAFAARAPRGADSAAAYARSACAICARSAGGETISTSAPRRMSSPTPCANDSIGIVQRNQPSRSGLPALAAAASTLRSRATRLV